MDCLARASNVVRSRRRLPVLHCFRRLCVASCTQVLSAREHSVSGSSLKCNCQRWRCSLVGNSGNETGCIPDADLRRLAVELSESFD